jgi:hypothetical protein
MEKFDQENIYVKHIELSPNLRDDLNNELNRYGLNEVWNLLCFKRKNFFTENYYNFHIDYSPGGDIVHSSIVIPVEGCEGTHMYWATGDYNVELLTLEDGRTTYARPKWKSVPRITHRIEINDMPMLTKVDVPHNVTSKLDSSYRTILSVRIKGNPTFDDVVRNISL